MASYLLTINAFGERRLKTEEKMGHPQFNRKELVEKLLKTYSTEDLVILTDNQLYQLYLNN